ncbi:MAG: TIGR00730 family Rossman fold protein [Rickettsiales bacterium]|jgi:uncharacterized protein (TIGR00730 family)|nr:TIGR00730 family Rossman fold protein [Rickettsiales bacterium]
MALLNLKFKKRFSVAVFCGASEGKSPKYAKAAREVGELIAANNMRLVYGAGGTGLMGELARAVLAGGGKVYGVSERVVATFEKPIREILHRTAPNMQKRKREFIDHSNAFIVLAGGWGTFDELFEVMVMKEIVDRHRRHAPRSVYREDRPIVIINTDGYYDPALKMIERGIKEGFMMKEDLKFFKVAKSPKEAFDFINSRRSK